MNDYAPRKMSDLYSLCKELVGELDKYVSMYSPEGEVLYRACRILEQYKNEDAEANYREIAEDCIDLLRNICNDVEEDAYAIFTWMDDIRLHIKEFDSIAKPQLRMGSEDKFTRFYYGQRTYAIFELNKSWYEVRDEGFIRVLPCKQRELHDAYKDLYTNKEMGRRSK